MWRWGTPGKDISHPLPGRGGEDAADSLEKGIWEHTGAGVNEGMFDKGGMTSGGFHRLAIALTGMRQS